MLNIQLQGNAGRLADRLMLPLMYLLQGTLKESPQRTHRWNNRKLTKLEVDLLERSLMFTCKGDATASRRSWNKIPLFHMPIFGGWRRFVVLRPVEFCSNWHVGWIASDDTAGVSLVPIKDQIRVTLGTSSVSFFGINAKGQQIQLEMVGAGTIGKADMFAKIPLL